MKLINVCALVALCLLSITACVEDDRRDRRSNDDDDDEVVVIDTEDKKEDGSSKSPKSCSPLDKDCQEDEEAPMMSSEDGEFTIYHISQGACGEATEIIDACSPDDSVSFQSEYWGNLCVRLDYDFAECALAHSDELCNSASADWGLPIPQFETCVNDAYEERLCDAFMLETLSCDGVELHELPEEYKSEAYKETGCTDTVKAMGDCAMNYNSDLCLFHLWKEIDPEHEFEPGENAFHDCMMRQ